MPAVHYPLTASQVIATMEKDGKPADKLRHVKSILDGTGSVYSVSVRKKVKIPSSKSSIFYVHLNPTRSAIMIQGSADGKKLSGILTNVKTSSITKSGTGRSSSKSSRSRSSRSKSPKRRSSRSRSKSPKRRSRSRRRSSKRR